MNLIINASEALGEKDGVIRIATSRVSGRPDGVNLPEAEYLRLEVADTGCGMTPQARARIFDPFFTTKFAGRGMGLAVVQGVVRDHGGAIHLATAPGQGSAFSIFLPCATEPAEAAPLAAPSTASERRLDAGTVLLVEDEAMLRQPLSAMLRKKGFTVLEADEGTAALELMRAHADEINLMLLDVTLPGISSREVFEQAVALRPALKVVLTSAYSREAVAASFAGVAIESFIRKPFRFAELMEVLQDALRSRSFAPQGDNGIDGGGAPGRDVAGSQCNPAQQ